MRVDPNPALAELQRLRPAKLRVYVRDADEPKAVAIPANRKKWERLGTTLEGLDWVRIEALDARGNITGVVAREDDAPEAAMDTVEISEAEALAPMVSLMLRAQQMALQQQSILIKPLIDGMAKLVQVQTDALGAVAGAYRMALAAASTVPAGGGKGDGEGDGDQALFRFLQVAMMMASKNGGPAAALGAVQTATASVKRTPSSPSTPRPESPPSSAAAPGR